MIPTVYRVSERSVEYPGTFTLKLEVGNPEPDKLPMRFAPGQFNMLYAFGVGESAISFSGLGSGDGKLIHTIRAQGNVTRALERLRAGDSLGVRGPFGIGWPLHATVGKEVLILAGGLGLAPLRPVIYAGLLERLAATRVRLFYGARRPSELLYREELSQWGQKLDLEISVDHGDGTWPGHIGVITDPLKAAQIDGANSVAFLCGPEIMMRFCIQVLLSKGVPPNSIYLSMERNMKCAIGLCGHCQWGPNFICKDGPVFCYEDIRPWLQIRSL
ncbi:FAD/NAD(P)-binding protein [Microbulbifer sp. THAF38]|uniref:FAD/NAD(P)-binding protein n=1 Tax=Microbulbifer sp. THAF38 TaxID=2587856 RepID=UPI0012AA9D73|nr:FAD/NAD(P)-binding protein [Microbulbifer sp. THAF38]QFT54877.1 Anaerobic sulfite reductase subunit B [Microbulbifer sp. THAF38]